MNTRARTGPPAANTRSKRLPTYITVAIKEVRNGQQSKPSKQARRLIKHITRLKNEVHKVMAVLNKDRGKLLKYRQLLRDPSYKKE